MVERLFGFIFIFFYFGLAVSAQNTSITGTIVGAKNTPLPYATVALMEEDSTVVNGAVTDEDGKFEIAPA